MTDISTPSSPAGAGGIGPAPQPGWQPSWPPPASPWPPGTPPPPPPPSAGGGGWGEPGGDWSGGGWPAGGWSQPPGGGWHHPGWYNPPAPPPRTGRAAVAAFLAAVVLAGTIGMGVGALAF